MPAAGSRNAESVRLNWRTLILASSGVIAALLASMGPAVPERSTLPPPGSCPVMVKGNDDAKEKLVISMLTLSYTFGFSDDPAREIVRRPPFTFSFATKRFGLPLEDEPAGFEADVLFPPRL